MRLISLFAAYSAALVASISLCDITAAQSYKSPATKVRSQIDAERGRVWIVSRRGVALYDAAAQGELRYVSLPDLIYAGEPQGCLPGIALSPAGETVISSDVMPVLWRIDPKTFAVTRHELQLDADNNKDVGFTEIRYSTERGEYVALSGIHGTVWRIDRELRYARKTARQLPRDGNCSVKGGW